MSRKLRHSSNGSNGAITITITDFIKSADGKMKRKQFGKLSVRKCTIVWHDGIETGNNKYEVRWEDFVQFMKKHPKSHN